MPDGNPLLLATTEVVNDLRLRAYVNVASRMPAVTIEPVAIAGDLVTIDTSEIGAGVRTGNARDRGTLIGVNLKEVPEGEAIHTFETEKDHQVLVVKRPAVLDPNTGEPLPSFLMKRFYEQTNKEYKRLKAEKNTPQE